MDSGSGCTMVNARVVVGPLVQRARTSVTADGRTAYGEDCQVTVTLKWRRLFVQAIAVSHLDALGLDCLLGVDVVDQMDGVSICRGLNSQFVVAWGKPPLSAPGGKRRAVDHGDHAPSPLTISDKDFEAKFPDGCWTVSWCWVANEPTKLQSRVGEYQCSGMAQLRASFLFWLCFNQPSTRLCQ